MGSYTEASLTNLHHLTRKHNQLVSSFGYSLHNLYYHHPQPGQHFRLLCYFQTTISKCQPTAHPNFLRAQDHHRVVLFLLCQNPELVLRIYHKDWPALVSVPRLVDAFILRIHECTDDSGFLTSMSLKELSSRLRYTRQRHPHTFSYLQIINGIRHIPRLIHTLSSSWPHMLMIPSRPIRRDCCSATTVFLLEAWMACAARPTN
ncbi:hypothetical protein VTL71DRAFT_9229 [Oculimacula yallundae]|uniref:Maturase K n=1 Tax=Oculimacula yallundae TaxID=86028 RepID=A0ABR4BSJ0_9HELO